MCIIRDRILAAFGELCPLKGFYKLTMDEVAARAGISKRTLYRYFSSKDALIEAYIDSFQEEISREHAYVLNSGKSLVEMIRYIVARIYRIGSKIINPMVMEDLRTHYPHYWEKIDSFRSGKALTMVTAFLDYKGEGKTRDIDPRIVTTVVLASIQAVLNPDFLLNNNLTFEKALSDLLRVFQHGFLEENE